MVQISEEQLQQLVDCIQVTKDRLQADAVHMDPHIIPLVSTLSIFLEQISTILVIPAAKKDNEPVTVVRATRNKRKATTNLSQSKSKVPCTTLDKWITLPSMTPAATSRKSSTARKIVVDSCVDSDDVSIKADPVIVNDHIYSDSSCICTSDMIIKSDLSTDLGSMAGAVEENVHFPSDGSEFLDEICSNLDSDDEDEESIKVYNDTGDEDKDSVHEDEDSSDEEYFSVNEDEDESCN